jgi:hypothetical protein
MASCETVDKGKSKILEDFRRKVRGDIGELGSREVKLNAKVRSGKAKDANAEIAGREGRLWDIRRKNKGSEQG